LSSGKDECLLLVQASVFLVLNGILSNHENNKVIKLYKDL